MQPNQSRLTRMLSMLVVFLSIASAASAADSFYVNATSVEPGETKTLAFILDNTTKAYAFQADIALPAGLEFVTKANGKVDASLSSRANSSFSITSNLVNSSMVRIGAFSLDNSAFTGNSGELLYLKVKAASSFEGGMLSISNALITNANIEDVMMPDCSVRISNGMDNSFFIPDFTIKVGGTKTVSMVLENEKAFSAFQADIYLSEGLTIVENTFRMTSRGEDHRITTRTYSSGFTRITCMSFESEDFVGNSGAVVEFDVTASSTAATNSKIELKNIIFSTSNAKEFTLPNATTNVKVERTYVSSIQLSQTSVTLAEGGSVKLEANVLPADASSKEVNWSSSNPSVATVDAEGNVKALSQGVATITASATDGSGVSASCQATVVKPVSGISLSETSITMAEGASAQLSATVTPETATNKTLAWSSSNTAVATVDQSGKVTAVAKGSAVITAKSTDGSNVSASCTVKVVKLVSAIALSETEMTVNQGQSVQLTATVTPAEADNKTLAWSSSNAAVATVDQTGKVTAVTKGTAVITAKSTDSSNVSASCTVKVVKPVSGITLNETQMTLVEGRSGQLTATVAPADADNKTLTWSSSNTAVATVDQTGKVTAVAKGSAVITAKSTDGSNVSASCTVKVVKLVSAIALSQTEMTVNQGQSVQLTATVTPAEADNKTLAWSSSNAAVATVDQTGKVTAVAKGSAVITAKSTDGSNVSASCTVKVVKPVSGITLNEAEMTLVEGRSGELTATVAPADADNKTLAWSSSNTAVAIVDQTGKVTAVAKGSAVITAKSTDGSNVSATCTVKVVKLVSAIALSETEMTVNQGQSVQLTATVTPAEADNKTLAWSSSNTTVATVDQTGKVTTVAKGSAVITAKSTDGSNVSASCNVKVVKPVTGITFNETQMTLVEGRSGELTATVAPVDADNKALAWSSSNTVVATVDQTGKVTAVAKGTAVITAKSTDGSNVSATCIVKVVKLVSAIALSETEMTVNQGQSVQLTATVTPAEADNKTLAWSSSNTAVATVDPTGKVTAVAKGTVVITAKSTDGSNVSASCKITVVKLASGIALSETEMTLAEGKDAQLTAIVPDDADNKAVVWSSSDEKVATVSQNGLVKAIAAGHAIITVKTADGSNISATCAVTVIKLVTDITLNVGEITLVEGRSGKLTAAVSPADANNKTLTWSSSNTAVATVDQTGKVTAVAKGTAVITAKSTDGSNVSASCTVKVVRLVSAITLSETEMTVNQGQSVQLTATLTPADADNKTLAWSSSNTAVAIVDQIGKVTAVAKGSAVITAKSTDGSNVSATCTVKVVKLVSAIALSETEMTVNQGQSVQLTATVTPAEADNKTLAWSSSNAAVATVDQTGKVTAVAKGNAVITATTTDGSNLTASCTVTVIKLASGIALSETEMTLVEGKDAQLTAIVPDDADNKAVVWSSSDEKVATVSQDGLVKAIAAGHAVITVKTADGSNMSATCAVTVIKLATGITLNVGEATVNEGEKLQLTATISPDNASVKEVAWSSSDELVATVDGNGVVTAVAKGVAVITAATTDGSNLTASCTVTVLRPVSAVYMDISEITMEVGDTETVTAYATPTDASDTALRWYSEDETVATVADGIVKAIGEGSTYIVAQSVANPDVYAKCLVMVIDPSGVADVAAEGVKVYVEGKAIHVANVPAGETAYVIQPNGRMIMKEASTGEEIVCRPEVGGVFIVAVGAKAFKVEVGR